MEDKQPKFGVITFGNTDDDGKVLSSMQSILTIDKDRDALANILLNYPIYAVLIKRTKMQTTFMLYYITNNIPVKLIVPSHMDSGCVLQYRISRSETVSDSQQVINLLNDIAKSVGVSIPPNAGFAGWL